MKLTKRELWLMEKSFSAGVHYGSFDGWLEEHVCNEANVRMALEGEAPDPSTSKVIEAAIELSELLKLYTCSFSENTTGVVNTLHASITEYQKVTP